MAQNITIANASYPDVPAIDVPKTGGGTARFTDTSPTTATDPDVTQGKIYFKANGEQSVGTGSGGGSFDPDAYEIITDPASQVGTAVVGTAVTTPDSFVAVGDVIGEKTTINIPTAAELQWNYSSGVLTIQGIALTVAAQTVGTGNATFVGGETSLVIKEKQV